MARCTVDAQRFDPYRYFRFRVKWGGRYVAGVSEVSALKRGTEVVDYREGADPSSSRKLTGRTKYEPITLERGVTHDTEFEKWASSQVSLEKARKDITLEVYDEDGQLARVYRIYRCWVSEFQATPDLDAKANALAIERIKLENDGWERDDDVTEPSEASP